MWRCTDTCQCSREPWRRQLESLATTSSENDPPTLQFSKASRRFETFGTAFGCALQAEKPQGETDLALQGNNVQTVMLKEEDDTRREVNIH